MLKYIVIALIVEEALAIGTVCPGNIQPAGQCRDTRHCQGGRLACVNGLCCPRNQPWMYACGGLEAASACINNVCGRGYTCVNGYCCECPSGYYSVGFCTNNVCSAGQTCRAAINKCCAPGRDPGNGGQSCPTGQTAVGACINNYCSASGTYCNTASNTCCRTTQQSCPTGESVVGSCVGGGCSFTGSYCYTATNTCCRRTTPSTCLSGRQPLGPCINRLCAVGYSCQLPQNICCN